METFYNVVIISLKHWIYTLQKVALDLTPAVNKRLHKTFIVDAFNSRAFTLHTK